MANPAYIEIDAQAGLAEFNITILSEPVIRLIVDDNDTGTGLQLGETHDKAYYGDLGKIAYDHSQQEHAELGEPDFHEWLDTAPLSGFLTDAPSDGSEYARKNGSWVVVTQPTVPVIIDDIFAEQDAQFPISYLKYSKDGNDVYVTDIPKANGVIAGGQVSWIELFNFSVGATAYYIEGTLYTVGNTMVGLSSSDATYSRIDIIVVDTQSQITVITGTPAATPQKPTIDPATQIELTQILVPAGSSEPSDIVNALIYDENVEWTGSSSGLGGINFADTLAPYKGTNNIEVTTISNGNTISFTNGSTVNVYSFSTFTFAIKLKAIMDKKDNLVFSFYNGTSQVSIPMIAAIDKELVGYWQTINVARADISFSSGEVDKLVFEWNRTTPLASHTGFYLDLIKWEEGIEQPPSSPESDPVFVAWRDAMFGEGAKQTGVDAGFLGQRSITDDYEYVCVLGGVAGVAIWKRIVLFQT